MPETSLTEFADRHFAADHGHMAERTEVERRGNSGILLGSDTGTKEVPGELAGLAAVRGHVTTVDEALAARQAIAHGQTA